MLSPMFSGLQGMLMMQESFLLLSLLCPAVLTLL